MVSLVAMSRAWTSANSFSFGVWVRRGSPSEAR